MNIPPHPAVILDVEKTKQNIKTMAAKARHSKVRFRPHFKTHISSEIGNWFKEEGVTCITVSSLKMAEYFAAHGWNDILVAIPANILEYETMNVLASKIDLHILVDSPEVIKYLGKHLTHPVGVWIKIDAGYGRAGISWDDREKISALATAAGTFDMARLKGFLTHSGHSYHASDSNAVKKIYAQSLFRMQQVQQHFPGLEISIGDTPGCSVVDDFTGVDEIRPGNFVFYDLMQYQVESCTLEQIAVQLATPVLSVYPEKHTILIHGGAVHFSKEKVFHPLFGEIFGLSSHLIKRNGTQIDLQLPLTGISQEHGLLQAGSQEMALVRPGDRFLIYPVHSCLAANLADFYVTRNGEKLYHMKPPCTPPS